MHHNIKLFNFNVKNSTLYFIPKDSIPGGNQIYASGIHTSLST